MGFSAFLAILTTFSTFFAETVTLLLRQQYLWTLTLILSHVLGSISMTPAGVFTIQLLTTRSAS